MATASKLLNKDRFTEGEVEIIGIHGIPEVKEGDDLVSLFLDAIDRMGLCLEGGDILVLSSKIVSKSEGRVVDLASIHAGEEAKELAAKTGKDARIAQLILDEASEIIRTGTDFVVTESKQGFVCANAGVDESNVDHGKAVLLPKSPNDHARTISRGMERRTCKFTPVLISDSIGRAFRDGVVGTCIGVYGINPILDRRGERDRFGKIAKVTKVGIADEICSAANLVIGEFQEGIPITIVRGLKLHRCESGSKMVFDRSEDVFRSA
jgi:coenzyme F420-0:L-glutamate ligase/coenzyme F420-1:gamma-L-glutamate ligase